MMIWCFFWCGFVAGRTLPAVFCPWSRCVFSRGLASLCLWFCRVGVFACAIAGGSLWLSCSFLWVFGPLCIYLFCLAVVGSPPCRLLLLFPLCGALAQFARWSLPLGVWLLCDGLVALLYCWECSCALSSLLHVVSWQQRPLALCGVFFPLPCMCWWSAQYYHAEVFIYCDPGPPFGHR